MCSGLCFGVELGVQAHNSTAIKVHWGKLDVSTVGYSCHDPQIFCIAALPVIAEVDI